MKNTTSNKYWENEKPIEADTGKNTMRYFKEAGKLQISGANWQNDKGETIRGKTVTLDITALKGSSEAMSIIKQIAAL